MFYKIKKNKLVLIIGGGQWGTTLSHIINLNKDLDCVTLIRSKKNFKKLLDKQNFNFLKETKNTINVTTDEKYLKLADFIYIVVPMSAHPEIIYKVNKYAPKDTPVCFCSKGLYYDQVKGGLIHPEYSQEKMKSRAISVLTGPSFASEVILNKPTALLIASKQKKVANLVLEHLKKSNLRIYVSKDIIGASIGGAFKNVLAIASGITTGKKFGKNARASIITRGISELIKLNKKLGGKEKTLFGLSGIGDIILSCSSKESRNMNYGFALGSKSKNTSDLTEGKFSVKLIEKRAKFEGIDMPICNAVNKIVNKNQDIDRVIFDLVSRKVNIE